MHIFNHSTKNMLNKGIITSKTIRTLWFNENRSLRDCKTLKENKKVVVIVCSTCLIGCGGHWSVICSTYVLYSIFCNWPSNLFEEDNSKIIFKMMNENPMAIFQITSFIWVKNSGGGLFRTLRYPKRLPKWLLFS